MEYAIETRGLENVQVPSTAANYRGSYTDAPCRWDPPTLDSRLFDFSQPATSSGSFQVEPPRSKKWRSICKNPAWARRKDSNQIIMNPYSIGSETTDFHTATTYTNDYEDIFISSFWLKYKNNCDGLGWYWITGEHGLSHKRTKLTTVRRCTIMNYKEVYGQLDHYRPDVTSISASLARIKQEAIASAFLKGFDVSPLTTLGEAKESLSLILALFNAAKSPLQTYRKLYEQAVRTRKPPKYGESPVSGDQAHKATAKAILFYNYAIVPLVLDILAYSKVAARHDFVFQTDRASRRFSFTKEPDRNMSKIHLYSTINHESRFTATSKSCYANTSSRLFARTAINPLATTWELIPFSFVLDWFCNMGDMVGNNFSSWAQPGTDRQMCCSHSTNEVEHTYLYIPPAPSLPVSKRSYLHHPSDGLRDSNSRANGEPFPIMDYTPAVDAQIHLLSKRVLRSFERTLEVPVAVPLDVEVTASLRRLLNGLALQAQVSTKSFRKAFL